MNKSVTTSTPGKLMIVGEHAVVYNRACLVTAVDQRLQVTATKINQTGELIIDAPEVDIANFRYDLTQDEDISKLPKAVKFVVQAIRNFYQYNNLSAGLHLETKSEFASTFGFGSSSAVTVGTVKALANLFSIKMDNHQIFDMAYQTVLDVQGVGSGFDLTAAIWGGLLYFETGGKKIEPLKVSSLPLLVGYTGTKADTVSLVKQVAELRQDEPQLVNGIFDLSLKIVRQSKDAVLHQDWTKLGQLMNIHQGLSSAIGVSSLQLEKQNHAAIGAGALGAKLSGAGGGDCMLAVINEVTTSEVKNAIEKAGGQILDVPLLAEGVRIEE